jgi:hypothetical protein
MKGSTESRRVGVLGAALVALALSGCATGSRTGDVDPFNEARPTSVRIIVQNRNFSDARLYTHRRGARKLLGSVTGKQDAEFTIDWDMTDPLSIEIDLLAGPKCMTREMQVDPGDVLELQIAPVFTNSSACR